MKEKMNNKGITLIVLVITVIVLFILAGTTVSMITGDGLLGEIGKQENGLKQEISQRNEATKDYLNYLQNGAITDSDDDDDAPTSSHTHDYTTLVDLKEATCTEDGYREFECDCDEKSKETIPALGHKINTTTKDATCTKAGSVTEKCTRSGCGYTNTTTIPALGHDYNWEYRYEGDWKYGDYICSRCGDIADTSSDYIGDNTIEEDNNTIGGEYVCDHYYYEVNTIPATCTTEGYTIYQCEFCGDTYEVYSGAVAGHDWWLDAQDYCEHGVYIEYCTCTVCGVSEIQYGSWCEWCLNPDNPYDGTNPDDYYDENTYYPDNDDYYDDGYHDDYVYDENTYY